MAQTFSFDDTLFGIQMKPPTLRRWIQAGLVGGAGKDREGWALEFSCFDISVLALVKAMVEFGVPVATAHAYAVRLMRQQGPWSDDQPASAYWNVFAEKFNIQVSRVAGRKGKAGWGFAVFAEPAYVLGAHLMLYPHKLIHAAIERAIEAAETRVAKKRSA